MRLAKEQDVYNNDREWLVTHAHGAGGTKLASKLPFGLSLRDFYVVVRNQRLTSIKVFSGISTYISSISEYHVEGFLTELLATSRRGLGAGA